MAAVLWSAGSARAQPRLLLTLRSAPAENVPGQLLLSTTTHVVRSCRSVLMASCSSRSSWRPIAFLALLRDRLTTLMPSLGEDSGSTSTCEGQQAGTVNAPAACCGVAAAHNCRVLGSNCHTSNTVIAMLVIDCC